MAITTASARLGTTAFTDQQPVEMRPQAESNEAQAVIYAAYRQVLGNDYLMRSERLLTLESLVTSGALSVRPSVVIPPTICHPSYLHLQYSIRCIPPSRFHSIHPLIFHPLYLLSSIFLHQYCILPLPQYVLCEIYNF